VILVERYVTKVSDVLILHILRCIPYIFPRLYERMSLSIIVRSRRPRRRREKSISRAAIKRRSPVVHAQCQLHANIMSRRRRRRYLINIATSSTRWDFPINRIRGSPIFSFCSAGGVYERGRCNFSRGSHTVRTHVYAEYHGFSGRPAPGKSTTSTGIKNIGRLNDWARRRAQAATPFIRNVAEVCSTCFPR